MEANVSQIDGAKKKWGVQKSLKGPSQGWVVTPKFRKQNRYFRYQNTIFRPFFLKCCRRTAQALFKHSNKKFLRTPVGTASNSHMPHWGPPGTVSLGVVGTE